MEKPFAAVLLGQNRMNMNKILFAAFISIGRLLGMIFTTKKNSSMQQTIYGLLAGILLTAVLIACKKGDSTPEEQQEFQIVEKNTNVPLPGAVVDGHSCSSSDFRGNCQVLGQKLATTTTNVEGKAFFAKSLGIQTLVITKENYWGIERAHRLLSPYELIPVAIMKARFIRVTPYPVGNSLNISILLDPRNALATSKSLGLPSDTTVYLKGVGNEMNGFGWMVGPSERPPFNFTQTVYINKFDTAEYTIRY